METKSNRPLRNDVLSNETTDQEGRRSSREKGFKLNTLHVLKPTNMFYLILPPQLHIVIVFYFDCEHIKEIKNENHSLSRHNVDRIHNERFQLWFRNHNLKFVLFKCKWVNNNKGLIEKDDYGFTLVNFNHLLYTRHQLSDEPFIFASQSQQVFYVDHPMEKEWRIVVKLKPRGFYDLGDNTPTIEHKEGHMELWPEQQLDDTTFESEEYIEWVREGVPGLEIYTETLEKNTEVNDDMKCILMMSFGSKWKESKHEVKTIGYDPYNIDIERLAHCPDRVEEDQWCSLVHYWSSKEAKMTKMNNGVKPTRIEVFKKTLIIANKQPINEIAGEVMKQMDDLAEVYPELNVPGSAPTDVYSQVMGSDTHGIVQTLGKGASPSLAYGPVYKRSQAEKRDFDSRVQMEVQKATSAMKIEMIEKMYEAKKEMEAMDKKLLEAKEETKENKEVMERKLSKAKMDMEEIIEDKVKEEIQAYVESLGINIDANLKSEHVPDSPLEDCQQPSSLVPSVHTRKFV
ncbi:hypothetical protein KY285_023769 [Solanum tuberosum]|nr:hypothetical protein KY289_024099 [Solanum tuberosum]KAH0675968.1 hypothetical protein KY285_023769 [Solanum tuberosum]